MAAQILRIPLLRVLLCMFLPLLSHTLFSQDLLESRQTSEDTYIYEITNKEARRIHTKTIWEVDSTYFHTLVDSYPTDKEPELTLPQGHYLKTYADKGTQKFKITTVKNFEVFILNNNTDLNIQVVDLEGKILNNARVKARSKPLHFDHKSESYIDKKSNKKGALEVSVGGFTAYYNISREINNSSFKSSSRKVLYGTPVKYVWKPVRYIIMLPIDGVKSLIHMWPQGTIYSTKRFFINTYEKTACLLNNDNCYSHDFTNKYNGYMVFNKPKYLPGDTVKLKAFITTNEGKAINDNVNIILRVNNKNIKLAEISPYAEGGYSYAFHLDDSLNLDLDMYYSITLRKDNSKNCISRSFKYEDYELSKNTLDLRVENREQFRGDDLSLFVKGTDVNELNIQGARLEVHVSPKATTSYFDNHVFIPDTLLFSKLNLKSSGETEIIIPDSIFPLANLDYTINVTLLTSENEVLVKKENLSFYQQKKEFDITLLDDSIHFIYKENNKTMKKKVEIFAQDNYENRTSIYKGTSPCTLPLNHYYATYIIISDSISQGITIANERSLINCYSERTGDSIFFQVDNPRNIPFRYNIYKRNTQKALGYTSYLMYGEKAKTKQNYFVSIQYLWGGKVQEEDYRIPLSENKLSVEVSQPALVFPGQTSKIQVSIKDINGEPVEDVDITAYGLTKKFGYTAPTVPSFTSNQKNKKLVNNFTLTNIQLDNHPGLELNYETWKLLAGIDSLEYYHFLYPADSIYKNTYGTQDAITQFSPFICKNGKITPIHVIYVDAKPVYFSWNTHPQPYSFRVDSGYHHIRIRTAHQQIEIDHVYFTPHRKTIISCNPDIALPKVTVTKEEPKLSDYEKRTIYKYISPYRNTFGDRYAYLTNGKNVTLLNSKPQDRGQQNFAGPVTSGVKFKLMEKYSTYYIHEPFFEYEYRDKLIKMRSRYPKSYPNNLYPYRAVETLNDTALTETRLKENWERHKDDLRYSKATYKYPNSTRDNHGQLKFDFSTPHANKEAGQAINTLVFKYDNPLFLRVYPGQTRVFHDLEEGSYQLIFFYPNAHYHIIDSVTIQPNGTNHYKFKSPEKLSKDSFSQRLSEIIESTIFRRDHYYDEENEELQKMSNEYYNRFKFEGEGDICEGYIFDEDNEPIIGVTVSIPGSNYGTISNLDGYYSLNIPLGTEQLNVSFIGYENKTINITNSDINNVTLLPSELRLEELVVIGYGTQKKHFVTSSISTTSLAGSMPGISGNITRTRDVDNYDSMSFSENKIMIRGIASETFGQKVLYIVDGKVFLGDPSRLNAKNIQSMNVLKGESATAIYGSKASNGVVVIVSKSGKFVVPNSTKGKGAAFDATFLDVSSNASSIRNNFSDYAFWQPQLRTNKEGIATFEVTFPDDITSWDTYFLAMNGKKQSGQTSANIKSYKPLMGQLSLPRFLLVSDTANAIGKALNYMPDSVSVKTSFEINGDIIRESTEHFLDAVIDTLPVIGLKDSVTVKYYLEKKNGYFDGESRTIPVFPIGLEESIGKFYTLDNDTSFKINVDSTLGDLHIYARADLLNVIEDEISHIIHYRYSCNEQMASKLKALLIEKKIKELKGEKFKNKLVINRLIRLLQKNQNKNEMWGWWGKSDEELWISLHALEALSQAKLQGYTINVNYDHIVDNLIWELENNKNIDDKIRILKIIHLLKPEINLKNYILALDKEEDLSLNHLLSIMMMKYDNNISFTIDTLGKYRYSSMFGNTYYSDEKNVCHLHSNDIQNTLLAYQILKTKNSKDNSLKKIRNYLLENRKSGYWRNTYESINIVETILPDILEENGKNLKPSLTFRGGLNKNITTFPYALTSAIKEDIEVRMVGAIPIYLTTYQHSFNTNPIAKSGTFHISTSFGTDSASFLKAGELTELNVSINIDNEAEYVMINVPIPAGCSYASKPNYLRNETHREYYKNETSIFCKKLSKGEHHFTIKLMPKYSGKYTVNPAKVELMYFPTFNANTELKKMLIQ